MIGLVHKDFLVMRKQLSYYLIFVVLYAGLTVAGVFTPFILPGIVVLVGMMLPMSSVGYDDQARWDKYAAATPAGRTGMVAARYLSALIVLVAGSALILVLMLVLGLTGLIDSPPVESIAAVLACLCAALVFDAVILPILIKFGAEKSRIISIIIFVSVFGGAMLITQLAKNMGPGGGVAFPAWLSAALPVVLALVAVGGFVISYFISLGIYGKKEL